MVTRTPAIPMGKRGPSAFPSSPQGGRRRTAAARSGESEGKGRNCEREREAFLRVTAWAMRRGFIYSDNNERERVKRERERKSWGIILLYSRVYDWRIKDAVAGVHV